MSAEVIRPGVVPFRLDQVSLGEGSVYARARDAMLELAREYPVDRLLAVFRVNAGLDSFGAEPPGAWEGFGHPREDAWGEHDYPGAEAAQTANLLRGHYAGHFLSMLSIAAASEDDDVLRRKVDSMVDGLGEVQEALARTGRYSHPGFLAAYGEWQFSRLEELAPYGEIWAPYYTCHKIMAGLLDAHELTGNARALEIVTGMAAWVAQRMSRLDAAQIQRMWSLYIAGEYGGMNETLARLSALTGDPALAETARLFDMDTLLEAGASGVDILTDMHANQHLPQLVGYLREYELTGQRRYLDAVIGLWDQIVPGRIYAHGGTGESELWGPPGVVAGDIGQRNAETCATYNMLKIARLLFQHTQDPRYMAYYENASLNHVLASRRDARSLTSPEVTYMFPVHPGALPEFDNIGTCCGGTGLENHVTHHHAIFFRSPDEAEPELWVNLLVPARLRWDEQNADVELLSGHPWAGHSTLRVLPRGSERVTLTVRVRIPEWSHGEATLRVGDGVLTGQPGTYVEVRRSWSAHDLLEIDVPMTLTAHGTIDDPSLQSVRLGPSLLVARDDATTVRRLPLLGLRRLDGTLVRDRSDADTISLAGIRYEPVWTGSDARYHMYVRDQADAIRFAGTETGVPARARADGSTLVSDVWAEPVPTTREGFLDRVLACTLAARREGLLTRDEVEQVLRGAALADVDGAGGARAVAFVRGTSANWQREAEEIRWTLPEEQDVPIPPSVRIEVSPPPAASGWHTSPPRVSVEAADLTDDTGAALAIEVRVGAGPWRAYDGPVSIDTEGETRVEARATAPSGLVGSATRELSVDTRPPVVEARVKRLGSSVELDFRATDEVSGVERIQWGGEDTFWATYQEAFVRSLGETEQVVEFSATDRAGNEGPRQRVVLPPRGEPIG